MVTVELGHQVRTESGLDFEVGDVERLLRGEDDFGGRALHGKRLTERRVDQTLAGDGLQPGAAGPLVVQHQNQEIEANQFMQGVPQAAEQGVEIPAADEGLGEFEQRAIFRGAVVGWHDRRLAWSSSSMSDAIVSFYPRATPERRRRPPPCTP